MQLFNVNVPAGELRSFYLVQYQFKFQKNTIQIQNIYHRDRIQSLEPKLMHFHGSVSKVILQDNWHRRRKSPKHRNNNVQEKPKNQCLFFKRTMRQCLKQTSVQSTGRKREIFFLLCFFTVAAEGKSGIYLLDFQWDNRNLAKQQEFSLPCLRVSHSLIPSLPCPSAKAPWHSPSVSHKGTRVSKTHLTKHETRTRQQRSFNKTQTKQENTQLGSLPGSHSHLMNFLGR